MAKQLINVGSQANDGTGDSIRSGAQKINSVINEIYNDLGDGTNLGINITNVTNGHVLRANGTDFVSAQLDYADIINKPTIPAAQVQVNWNSESGVTAILNKPILFSGSYEDLDDLPNFAVVATSGSYDDLLDVPAFADVATSGSYDDLTDTPSLFSGSYEDLTDVPAFADVATSGSYDDLADTPTFSDVATSGDYGDLLNAPVLSDVATSGDYADLDNSPETLLATRGTVSVTTGSLNNDASEDLQVVAYKAYALLKIQTSIAARVVIYTSSADRTSDAGRSQNTPFTSNSGVIADVITTGSTAVAITPGVIGFNNDSTVSNNIYLKIVNKSGQTNTVDVTFTLLKLEA